MTLDLLAHLLDTQSGVISRAQAEGLGATPADLRRLVRRRELARLHPGRTSTTPGRRPGCSAHGEGFCTPHRPPCGASRRSALPTVPDGQGGTTPSSTSPSPPTAGSRDGPASRCTGSYVSTRRCCGTPARPGCVPSTP
ncbi:MAG: type IV toxin-antitoxin system AbiEi family antitoxin domain-containing protein [Nocardioides sp.]|uniref:type IV toxin-antitoxin system AbiEi family antitoxin domain-containing protein n=1 Tax=Nocardioides sp. TaxID=35761 RepID=UPI003F0C2B5B